VYQLHEDGAKKYFGTLNLLSFCSFTVNGMTDFTKTNTGNGCQGKETKELFKKQIH